MSSYRRHFFHNVAPLSSHSILIYFRTRIQKNDWFALELLKIICEADLMFHNLWLCHDIVYFLINIPTNRNI